MTESKQGRDLLAAAREVSEAWKNRPVGHFATTYEISAEWLARVYIGDRTPRPLEDWHEDDGHVLWWKLPVDEPPFVGTPLDSDWIEDYYTHWIPMPLPIEST